MKIEIHATKNFTAEEAIKFRSAMVLLSKVLGSKEFRDRFLAASFRHNQGKSNGEILAEILSGKDKYNRIADQDLDVSISIYYKDNNVIGYTYSNSFFTYINRKFFSRFKLESICGNVFHEYLHNLGYRHPGTDRKSVPYVGGYLARDIAKRMKNDNMDPPPPPPKPKKKKKGCALCFWR